MNSLPSLSASDTSYELELELERAFAGTDRKVELVVMSFDAPLAPAEALVAGTEGDAWVFAPAAGFECAALGASRVLTAAGPERFESIQSQASALFERVAPAGSARPAEPVRLFGGFSFQNGRAKSELWSAFGEARFVLPRLVYSRHENTATLSLTLAREELENPAARRAAAREVARARRALAEPPVASVGPVGVTRDLNGHGREEWARLVEAIREEIAREHFEKVVLARRVDLSLEVTPDPAQVLARLRAQAPECTRFLLRTQARSFLGAAPERLLRKRGLSVETEAVAGSAKPGDQATLARLLESDKDLGEHEIVVRGIVRALEPVAASIEAPRRPELHQLRHVVHLRTPIRAKLGQPSHVLSLVARLHPTPAVGGLPGPRALEWIAEHEPDERGWYAGPLGWFDQAGDGEFVVALRSGVIESARAHLYVGAGIVRGSSPAEEYAETEWKLAALAGALGVGP